MKAETNKKESRDLLRLIDFLVDETTPSTIPAEAPILTEIIDSVLATGSPTNNAKDASFSETSTSSPHPTLVTPKPFQERFTKIPTNQQSVIPSTPFPTLETSQPTETPLDQTTESISGSFTEIPTNDQVSKPTDLVTIKDPILATYNPTKEPFPTFVTSQPTETPLEQTTESISGSFTEIPTNKQVSEPTQKKTSVVTIKDLILATEKPSKTEIEQVTQTASQSFSLSPGMLEPTQSPYPTSTSSEILLSISQSQTTPPNSTYSYSWTFPPYPTRTPLVIDKITAIPRDQMHNSTYIMVGVALGVSCLAFILIFRKSRGRGLF